MRFVVTYPPGGSSDVMARIIGQQLTEMLGPAGHRGVQAGRRRVRSAWSTLRKQPADGYTFLLGNFGPVVAKPLLSKV